MDSEIKTLLEQLLTAHVLVRSRAIRTAWRSIEEDKTGAEITDDKLPSDDFFVDQAIHELKAYRKRVVAALSE